MRMFFQILVSMVFMPTMLLAAGGVTMQYNADEANLRDGDVFYADRHYRAPLDTIKKTINGLLGNSNIAADAKIVATKLDSSGRFSIDSVVANKGIRTTGVATVDSLKSTKGVSGTTARFSGAAIVGSISSSGAIIEKPITGNSAIEAQITSGQTNATSFISAVNDAGAALNIGSRGSAVSGTDFGGLARASRQEIRTSGGPFLIGTNDANDIVLGTSDAERVRISSAGLVGIGRAPVSDALEVQGTISSRCSSAGLSTIEAYDDAGSGPVMFAYGSGVAGNSPYAAMPKSTSSFLVSTKALLLCTTAATDIVVGSNSAERLRVTSDGAIRPTAIATPANPAVSAMQFYFKGAKFVLQYNDAGIQRWKYLDLSGTGVTWVYSATAP